MPTICEIQTCINNLTTASESSEFAILAGQAVRCTSNNLSFHVATVADLPDLLTTDIPNGQMVFVASLGIPVVASKYYYEWRSIDGRLVRKDGSISLLRTWGLNNCGQLGDGTTTTRSSPGSTSGGGTTWCQTSVVGKEHGAAVKTDGTLWTWGRNSTFGALGNGTVINRSSPGTVAGGGITWSQVSTGGYHTAALKTDGTAWTWGRGSDGQLGDGSGTSRCSPVSTADGGTTWCSISAGCHHTAAVKTDGTLWTWGRGTSGTLGNGTVIGRNSPGTTAGGGCTWCAVSAGYLHEAAVKTDGTLWTWGQNCSNVVGGGRLGDNSVINRSSPVTTVGGGTNWCTVSAGIEHTGAVKTDGTLWMWGLGGSGRLGDGSLFNRSSPVTTVGGGTNWCTVSSGPLHTGAVKTDGTLWTWGYNSQGNLGDLTVANRSSPVTTIGGGSWCQVSTGDRQTAAICLA